MIRIAGIAASPRKNKNTEFFLKKALETIEKSNQKIKTDFFTLSEKRFSGCISCEFCRSHFSCSQKDDLFPILEALKDDNIKGILVASPVYMGGMTSQAKAFFDRSVLFRRNGFHFKDKIAGAIAVGGSRNGGQELTLQNIHAAFMIHDMIVLQDNSPTAHFGGAVWERVPNGPENDKVSLDTVLNLGKKMVDIAEKLYLS